MAGSGPRSKGDRPRWSSGTASSSSSKPATDPHVSTPNRVRILLARHGQSTWNAAGRWQGRADPPLSELGQR
ncbi:MAG: histidine phosphatase family protein, partial [Acidimicrobiia bacterium]